MQNMNNNDEGDDNVIQYDQRLYSECGKTVEIPHNSIGGFWYLYGYEDKNGTKHYGGCCYECFDKLRG